jgi:YegS/Rv2252/BmrU family lipid kinase
MPRVVAIVNPVAGKARGAKLRSWAIDELKRLFPDITFVESNAPGHATVLAQGARDAELVIAVGGDGTVREVASGLVSATGALEHLTTRPLPLLAVIPVGSGNDFIKTIGIPADITNACRIAREGRDRLIDVVQVEMAGEGASQQTYFINAAGFGFDAAVTAQAQKMKRLRGLPLYVTALFRTVGRFQCPLVRIRAGRFETEQRILMIAATNGRYYGGGMKVAPEAKPDDGLIEVCIGDSMGRLSIMRKLPRFVAGTHTTLKEVRMLREKELELQFLEPVMVQFDGDVLVPQPFSRFRLMALPKAINLRVP